MNLHFFGGFLTQSCFFFCKYLFLRFDKMLGSPLDVIVKQIEAFLLSCRSCLNNVPLYIYPGHIPSLIKADMLESPLTRLVAVNSIFFKGLWKSRFLPENTKMRAFTGGNGDVYKVPMMSQLSVFNISESRWLIETVLSITIV